MSLFFPSRWQGRYRRLLSCLVLGLAASGVAAQTLPSGSQVAVDQAPGGLAFSANGRQLYVTSGSTNTLSVIDVVSGKVTARLQVPEVACEPGRSCRSSYGTARIVIDGLRNRAYVTEIGRGALLAFDLSTRAVVWSVPFPESPLAIGLAPDGETAWVKTDSEQLLTTVDLVNGRRLRGDIKLEDKRGAAYDVPPRIAMARDGRRIYVGDAYGNGINVFSTSSRRKRVFVESKDSPFDMKVDSITGNLFALYRDGVVEHAQADVQPSQAFRFCRRYRSLNMALSADGRLMALSLFQENKVLVVARDTGLISHAFSTREKPSELLFSPDGNLLAVIGEGERRSWVSLLDVATPMDLTHYVSRHGELFCIPDGAGE